MPLVRTFLAIPLPEEIVLTAQGFCRKLAGAFPHVRWVRPETMHLTLRFFGDLPEEYLEKIGEIMLSVGRLHPPFQVPVAGIGAFPSSARPRVIWLGIQGGQALMHLYSALDAGLERIGLPGEERAFSPHLTLGRSRGPAANARAALEPYREAPCGILEVDKIVLFESRLQATGAVHLPRKTVFLGE